MPFDPTQPAFQSPNSSAVMRAQLNALNDKIDAIPAGPPGAQGEKGDKGDPGDQGIPGNDGAQGPPFADAVVDGVTTLNAGEPAAVAVSFDGTHVRFSFAIPQGASGGVTPADLTTAIAGTSANTNAVATLGLAVSDPPTQAELQAVVNKIDELILALRRL